jgi:RNA-dependent RNA polymerase
MRSQDWYATDGGDNEDPEWNYYRSDKALGVLYRAIPPPKLVFESPPRATRPLADALTLNLSAALRPLLLDGAAKPVRQDERAGAAWLADLFRAYQAELRYVCVTHTLPHGTRPLQEEEAVLGLLLEAKDKHLRKDRAQRVRTHTTSLVRETRLRILGPGGGGGGGKGKGKEKDGDDDGDGLRDALRRAWEAWCYAMRMSEESRRPGEMDSASFGARSFGLVALGAIFDTMDHLSETETASYE